MAYEGHPICWPQEWHHPDLRWGAGDNLIGVSYRRWVRDEDTLVVNEYRTLAIRGIANRMVENQPGALLRTLRMVVEHVRIHQRMLSRNPFDEHYPCVR